MEIRWQDHIESTLDVPGVRPRFKGTRIPVSLVLGYLAAGATVEEVLAEYDDLTDVRVRAALDYARDLAEYDVAA